VSRDFLLQVFFHESPSTNPLKITSGQFRFFSKIHGDIRKSRCTTGVNDTGGKFATGIYTGGKIAAGIIDTGGKLPPVSTTPAANLSPVSTTPVASNGNNIRLQTP
jgi:hypothetical protein